MLSLQKKKNDSLTMLEFSMHLNDSLLLVDVYLTNDTGLEFYLKLKFMRNTSEDRTSALDDAFI
jgi:response regulator of citrate/malate metabolism